MIHTFCYWDLIRIFLFDRYLSILRQLEIWRALWTPIGLILLLWALSGWFEPSVPSFIFWLLGVRSSCYSYSIAQFFLMGLRARWSCDHTMKIWTNPFLRSIFLVLLKQTLFDWISYLECFSVVEIATNIPKTVFSIASNHYSHNYDFSSCY